MHVLNTPTRRGFLKIAAAAAILLTLVGSLIADVKSPNQMLGGKPADTSSGSSRYYDGHGRFDGHSTASGSTTRLYDSQGRMTGRVMRPKTQHECTSVAARLPVAQHFREKTLGSTTARVRSTGAALRLEIRRGFTTATELILGGRRPRAARRGITIRLGDMPGVKRSRLVCPSPSLSTGLDSKMTRLYSTTHSTNRQPDGRWCSRRDLSASDTRIPHRLQGDQ